MSMFDEVEADRAKTLSRAENFGLDNPHYYAGGSMARRTGVRMTPASILSQYRSGDLGTPKAEQESLGDKPGGLGWLKRISNEGVESQVESVRQKGFLPGKAILLNPNHPNGPTIIDGHHRLFAAHEVAPHEPIPVMFTNDLHPMRTNEVVQEANQGEKLREPKPNRYESNCKACGQKVGVGDGVTLKMKNGPYHTYHEDHLSPVMHRMYKK